MAQAGSVYGAAFRACVVTAIPYKVYAVRAEHDEVACTDILERAEVTLRKSEQSILVSLSASRRELWAFRLISEDRIGPSNSDPDSSAPLVEQKSTVTDALNGSAPDFELVVDPAIQTVAQGVILPPFTVTPDISIDDSHLRSYRLFLKAVELRCLDALLSQGDREIYEAFGRSAVLNTTTNSLTRVDALLQHDGALVLRLTSQKCRLQRLFLNSNKLATPHVWLLPHAVPGRVFPSQKYEEFVERPNKNLARALYNILTSHFVTNVCLESLERSTWLRVSTADAEDLLWPAILVTEVASSSNGSLLNGDADDSYQPLARIEKPDPYTTLSEAMLSIRRQRATPVEADPEVGVASLHQTMHPPLAPPPSPRPAQISMTGPSSSASMSNTGHHTASASLAPSVAATAAPTPTATGSHHQLHVPTIYPTPVYQTPSIATPTAPADDWMNVDEDEVGDADFNFFDLPVVPHGTPLFRPPEEPPIKEEPELLQTSDLKTSVEIPHSESRSESKPQWSDRAQFSNVDLNTSALDAKYSSGGQFFVPPPPDEADQSTSEHSEMEDVEEDEEDDEEDENPNADAELSSVYSDDIDFGVDSAALFSWQQPAIEDTTELWLKALRAAVSTPSPIDATRLSNFRQLIPQLVYDGGFLSDLLDAPLVTGPIEVLSGSTLGRIRSVFPNLRHCSLMEMSGTSGEDSLQLLSPPLVSFKRNNMELKARISIIKFWRLMGLAPLIDVEGGNISVILVTLSSPTVVAGAQSLLTALKTMYEGGNLGELELPTFGDVHDGLLTISADLRHTSGDAVGDLYETACAQLKHQLQHHFRRKKLVLITACPTSRRGSLLTAGVASQLALGYGAVRTACPNAQWLLCSLDTLVSRYNHDMIPSQSEAMRLALLIYARYPSSQAAFQLAGLAPQSVGLQFSAQQPTYLLDDEPVMQISYLICEKRWVFVAWSDQWARTTHVDVLRMVDYHDKGDRALHSVFSEIWARSESLTKSTRPKWRFCIAKCGAMELSESLVWRRVMSSNRNSETAHCLMDLPYPRGVAVNDSRSVRHSTQSQASTLEMVDSVIVDSTNETYGVAIHRIKPGVSSSVSNTAAGFLVKPTPQGHLQFEVRLLLVHGLPGTPQKVMNRVLGQFRRLASLAESKGVSTENTIVPWHVLAVTKLEAAAIEMCF